MSEECRMEYVKLGLTVDSDKYESLLLGSAIWGVLGIASAALFGGKWFYFSIMWSVLLLMTLFFGFYLIRKKQTVKIKISIQALIYTSYVLEISLLQATYFVMLYGFEISLIFLYLPVILNPIILSILDYRYFCKKWKDNIANSSKFDTPCHKKSIVWGSTAAWFGMHLAAIFFSHLDQNSTFLVILILLEVLNLLFSIGLANIQRLYLIHVLKNSSFAKELNKVE